MHREALTEAGAELFDSLGSFTDFYLAGGTALALQIGHRISVDFDFFTPDELSPRLSDRLRKAFSGKAITPSVTTNDELTVFIDAVKVTFLHYPFSLLTPTISLNGVVAASVDELAAMKAYTIGRRVTFKDYVDLHAVFSGQHVSLLRTLELANQKFRDEFNDRLFLEQLVSFEDVSDEPIHFLGATKSKAEIQQFMEREVGRVTL